MSLSRKEGLEVVVRERKVKWQKDKKRKEDKARVWRGKEKG